MTERRTKRVGDAQSAAVKRKKIKEADSVAVLSMRRAAFPVNDRLVGSVVAKRRSGGNSQQQQGNQETKWIEVQR